MLVTRKKNQVRNGRARFSLKNDLENDVSPKDIFVHQGVNREDIGDDGLEKSNKVDVLSNHSDSALAKFKIPDQREVQNEDLCLIDAC